MKIKKSYDPDKAAGPIRPLSARERARQAAIEKELSRYIQLTCGHFQTLETSERYAFATILCYLDSKPGVFCERCNDFTTIKPKPEAKEYSQEPLF